MTSSCSFTLLSHLYDDLVSIAHLPLSDFLQIRFCHTFIEQHGLTSASKKQTSGFWWFKKNTIIVKIVNYNCILFSFQQWCALKECMGNVMALLAHTTLISPWSLWLDICYNGDSTVKRRYPLSIPYMLDKYVKYLF